MKDDFNKFLEHIKTDETLQKKLDEAGRNYTGEQTEEAVFNSVVVPIAKDAGYSIDLDDAKQAVKELNLDEMEQVAGGWGFGANACVEAGIGIGISGSGNGDWGGCLGLGYGKGASACAGSGVGGYSEV